MPRWAGAAAPSGDGRGFTIVEVMVSLAIVAVLLGLLFPALAAGRGTAHTVQSLSNLRQMTIAAGRYADAWRRWPVAVRYESGEEGMRTMAWDWVDDGEGGHAPGALWTWTDDPEAVMQCPALPTRTNSMDDPATGYNYNTSYIGGEAPFPFTGWDQIRWGLRPWATRRPDAVAIFGAGGFRSGPNKFMRAPGNPEGLDPWTQHAGAQAYRYHGGRTVVAWLDGHVGTGPEATWIESTTEMLAESVLDFPRHGFLSFDDSAYDPR